MQGKVGNIIKQNRGDEQYIYEINAWVTQLCRILIPISEATVKRVKKGGRELLCNITEKKMLKGDVVWLTTHVQTCLAPNQVVASCVNTDLWLDKITQKSRHARVLRHLLQNMYRYRWFDSWVIKRSSSLRPGCNRFTCGKWFIGYNLGTDYGAKSQFGTHKELIVLNIFKHKYCVNKSRNTSRDHFDKNLI